MKLFHFLSIVPAIFHSTLATSLNDTVEIRATCPSTTRVFDFYPRIFTIKVYTNKFIGDVALVNSGHSKNGYIFHYTPDLATGKAPRFSLTFYNSLRTYENPAGKLPCYLLQSGSGKSAVQFPTCSKPENLGGGTARILSHEWEPRPICLNGQTRYVLVPYFRPNNNAKNVYFDDFTAGEFYPIVYHTASKTPTTMLIIENAPSN
ncbi:uncharacterized protein LY89DRAFT_740433 [Mollisia scopiformis]|uniref:AA1-like domain-containing protein n=1 Tax=Mollisia scopiformis TaxID=149040 RepID=A0A132BCD0_MOLSC|nr:uncharacterized protein LY89DRAFT_740433 [Mollisia scopiformis]KUJ10028.1 hypothetical protein LY89DRAFT_740433 [Mollisia scopiformis]